MTEAITNITYLQKGKERWVVIYNNDNAGCCLAIEAVVRWLMDAECNFTKLDAQVMCREILPGCPI